MTAIAVTDLTTSTVDGTGVFDLLMKANSAHLEAEFTKGRIRGPEYSQVYLGSLQTVLQIASQFLLDKQKSGLEADLLTKQIELATVEVQKANAELAILLKGEAKIDAEIAQIEAQTQLTIQQKANLAAEALNIPKQGALIDAQKDVALQEKVNLVAEELNIDARTDLVIQQKANAIIEGTVLTATECKLKAEFDNLMEQKLKIAQETALLGQKVVTEKAQTMNIGVDDNSVIGKQKGLYQAQTDGFKRDAEQKVAQLLVSTWNVRRTTDEGTVAGQQVDEQGNPVGVNNRLGDADIGAAIAKLLAGIGVTGNP